MAHYLGWVLWPIVDLLVKLGTHRLQILLLQKLLIKAPLFSSVLKRQLGLLELIHLFKLDLLRVVLLVY